MKWLVLSWLLLVIGVLIFIAIEARKAPVIETNEDWTEK